MKQAFIYLRPGDDDTVDWLLRDNGHAKAETGSGTLDDLSPLCGGRQIVMIVPGDQVLLTEVGLDIKPASKLRKAIPYALEEKLSEDVENLHFATGASRDGKTPVAIIRKSLLEKWTQRLQSHGLQPRFAVPDLLQLTWEEKTWSLLVSPERVIIRLGLHEGFVTEREGLEDLLMAVLDTHELPEKIQLWYCGDVKPMKWSASAPPVDIKACENGPIGVLAENWDFRPGINMLQGTLSSEPDIGKALRPWRWAAGLAVAWLAVSTVGQIIERQQLRTQMADIQSQMENVYRKTFPETQKIVNPRVQMEQQLKALKGGAGSDNDDYMVMLASVSSVLTKNTGTTLDSINYRSKRLTLQLSAANLSALDELKTQISEQTGLKAELASADSGAGKASGQIRIQSQ